MSIIKNKRGWMKLVESITAILILASVLIVVYVNKPQNESFVDQINIMQIEILNGISSDSMLREEVVSGSPNSLVLENYVKSKIRDNFLFSLSICPIDNPILCRIDISTDKEIFVENTIISSTLNTYRPKLVRLYMWEK
jgi:hypothetical protein